MPVPALRMQCDKRQHIHRGFEYIEPVVRPAAVKTVLGIAASNIPFEALSEGVQSAFVRMTGNAVFIVPDEYGVVIFFGTIRRWFRALIDQLRMDESIQYLPLMPRCWSR